MSQHTHRPVDCNTRPGLSILVEFPVPSEAEATHHHTLKVQAHGQRFHLLGAAARRRRCGERDQQMERECSLEPTLSSARRARSDVLEIPPPTPIRPPATSTDLPARGANHSWKSGITYRLVKHDR
mmetsp:Transcript_124253/g.215394  ORF Transcript_124253/g.215394 Transcript_124253/m.215394 type:complete len:126 (+) Transcript_124253:417-794(+)